MKSFWICLGCLFLQIAVIAQALFETNGPIRIKTNPDSVLEAGSIRWTGTQFEGYTGSLWISLGFSNKIQDYDGHEYHTVRIGEQQWMAENLYASTDANGVPIQNLSDHTDWSNTIAPAFCFAEDYYQHPKHGYLYNFYAVSQLDLCPVGWRVPEQEDWAALALYVGGFEIAGGELKETTNKYWEPPNAGANNNFSFNARGIGFRESSGIFSGFGESAGWWAKNPIPVLSIPVAYELSKEEISMEVHFGNNKEGFSVRCIKE